MRREPHLFFGSSRRLHALPDARPATDAKADACLADAEASSDAPATDTRPVEIHQPWMVLP